jgi:hypothetical protein
MHDDPHDEDVNPIEILEVTTYRRVSIKKERSPEPKRGKQPNTTVHNWRRSPSDGCAEKIKSGT